MDYRATGEAGWAWTLGQLRDGPVLAGAEPGDADSFYAGPPGLAPVLAEVALHRPLNAAEVALRESLVERLSAVVPTREDTSLYDGLGGDATVLRLLAPGAERAPLERLRGRSWDGQASDIIMGTAGVVLTAVWAGALDIAEAGGEALLKAAEPTEGGLDWRMRPGHPSSSPNFSHGTAGVASALAVAGAALGRPEFVEAATAGARHLLSIAWLEDDGFVVPHTIPYSKRDVEPVTYNWCHGPAGTSQLFAALAHAGVSSVGGHAVDDLRRRCLRSVLASGLPERLRPGFWDNDGRCCGTAGVGDILLDAYQSTGDPVWLAGAEVMGDALVARALTDGGGAYWRFIEHRSAEPLLPPGSSWMQGSAGIAAFLFRLARVVETGPGAPVVDRPDQWWTVPAPVRS